MQEVPKPNPARKRLRKSTLDALPLVSTGRGLQALLLRVKSSGEALALLHWWRRHVFRRKGKFRSRVAQLDLFAVSQCVGCGRAVAYAGEYWPRCEACRGEGVQLEAAPF